MIVLFIMAIMSFAAAYICAVVKIGFIISDAAIRAAGREWLGLAAYIIWCMGIGFGLPTGLYAQFAIGGAA